jgi:murein DD-endopeptidase MepM/ murein hydrolase activator NlpD
MSGENVRERKKKQRFTLVFVPETESGQPRTFSVTKWKLYVALVTAFFGIIVLVTLTLIYTPARSLLPVSNSEVEELYGKQIAAIQDQVITLYKEMTRLRGYNLQLRKALGENISPADSSFMASTPTDKLDVQRNEIREGKNSQRITQNINAEPAQESRSNFTGLTTYIQRQQTTDMAVDATFPMSLPVDGYVSRGFDTGNFHYGIDLVSKISSPILSSADGRIIFSGWTYDDGLMIIIAHSLGYMTVYKHNEALMKNAGVSVKRGEVIALLGNTGKTSSGPHLHFEVWKDGIPYDPANYLLMTQ